MSLFIESIIPRVSIVSCIPYRFNLIESEITGHKYEWSVDYLHGDIVK